MNPPDTDKSNTDTMEYLLGVVFESREKRCAEIRERAQIQANDIIKQAYTRVRGRVHRHVMILREKHINRISAAHARNQTLIRQRRQATDKEILDSVWPMLRESLKGLWSNSETRSEWLGAAIMRASSTLLEHDWLIEHPVDLNVEEQERLKHFLIDDVDKTPGLRVSNDIEAGIRIIVNGTVIDASLEGLLQQKAVIGAMLIARIKQNESCHE